MFVVACRTVSLIGIHWLPAKVLPESKRRQQVASEALSYILLHKTGIEDFVVTSSLLGQQLTLSIAQHLSTFCPSSFKTAC